MKHGFGNLKSFSDPCSIRVSSVAKLLLDGGSDEHVRENCVCHYSEGVASHSPGLFAQRATLGLESSTADVPRRGSVIQISRMTQPFQGRPGTFSSTQGSSLRGQPWAM